MASGLGLVLRRAGWPAEHLQMSCVEAAPETFAGTGRTVRGAAGRVSNAFWGGEAVCRWMVTRGGRGHTRAVRVSPEVGPRRGPQSGRALGFWAELGICLRAPEAYSYGHNVCSIYGTKRVMDPRGGWKLQTTAAYLKHEASRPPWLRRGEEGRFGAGLVDFTFGDKSAPS